MAVTFVAAGTFTSGTGALTVTQPAGAVAGDLLLLAVESANQAVAVPAGYVAVSGSPQGTGTAAAAGGVMLSVFYKIHSGAEASVAVAASGNHTTGRLFAFSGNDTFSPIYASAGSVGAATTAMVFPTITTGYDGQMIVLLAAMDLDSASTTSCTGYTNAALTGITERSDNTVVAGAGGGLVVATATKSTAGVVGTTSATGSTATTHAYITLAISPPTAVMESAVIASSAASSALSTGVLFSASASQVDGLKSTAITIDAVNGMSRVDSVYDGQLYHIFVKDNGGAVYYSSDAVTWLPGVCPAGYTIARSAAGAGVAVGLRGGILTTGNVVSLQSGTSTWTNRTIPGTGVVWSGIAFGAGLFVATSESTAESATSPDGITWTRRSFPGRANCIAFCGGIFIAFSTMDAGIYTSADGLTWATRSFTSDGEVFQSIAYVSGRFVASNTTNTNWRTSTDGGVTWTSFTGPVRGIVASGSGVLLAHSDVAEGIAIGYSSPDGVSWSNVTLAAAPFYSKMVFGGGKFLTVGQSTTGNFFTHLVVSGSVGSGTLTDHVASTGTAASVGGSATGSATLTTINALYAAAPASATATAALGVGASLIGSISGLDLLGGSYIPIRTIKDLIYAGGQYVAVGADGPFNGSNGAAADMLCRCATSPDGITWTLRNLGPFIPGDFPRSIGYVGGTTFVIGTNLDDDNLTSTDGITWTINTVSTTMVNYGAAYNSNGRIWADWATDWYTSTNGTAWAGVTPPTGTSYGIAFGAGTYRWFKDGYYTSTDGVAWNSTVATGGVSWVWVTQAGYVGGSFLGYGPNGSAGTSFVKSPDGTAWTAHSVALLMPSTPAFATPYGNPEVVVHDGTNYVYSCRTGATYQLAHSADTVTWSAHYTPVSSGMLVSGAAGQVLLFNVLGGFAAKYGASSKQRAVASGTLSAAPVLFQADATVTSDASAALSTTVKLAAAGTGLATATGALRAAAELTGSVSGVSQASAGLTTQTLFAGASSATSASTAALATGIILLSASAVTAGVSGDLTTAIQLAGSGVVLSTATSGLTVAAGNSITASSIALSLATAELVTQINLAGSAASSTTSTAGLASGIQLVASVFASSAGTGGLSAGITLQSSVACQATASASVTSAIRLAAAAAAVSAATSPLTTLITLISPAVASAAGSASMTAAISLAGATFATASSGATMSSTSAALAVAVIASASSSAALTTSIRASAAAVSNSSASGTLFVPIYLSGSATSITDSTADLSAYIQFLGNLFAGMSALSGTLTDRELGLARELYVVVQDGRVMDLGADTRSTSVTFESRVMDLGADTRSTSVTFESRVIYNAAELRSLATEA